MDFFASRPGKSKYCCASPLLPEDHIRCSVDWMFRLFLGCLRKSSLSRWARIPYGPQSECTLPAGPEYLHTHVMSVQGLTKKIKSHTDIAGDHAPRPDKPPPLSERQLGSPSRKDTRNVSTPEHISAKRPRPRVYEPRYWPQPTCTRMVMSNEN